MFKRKRFLGVVICLLMVNVFAVNGFCVINLNSGDVMDSYMGVVAYSNGENSGTKYGNLNYQCVAYVKRFYRQYYKLGLDQISVGQARNYYLKFESLNFAQFGLERYDNNGYVPPKPTDILVFNNSNNVGHVAIITNVTATTVSIIEQNWSRNKCTRDLPFTISNGKYFIGTNYSYPVLGWLGLPIAPTCRWDFNTTGWCEDWTMTNLDGYSVENGVYSINPGKPDPYINSPAISVSAANSALIISMASNAPDGVGAIYFTTAISTNWNEDKKVDFSIVNDGKYHDYFVSMKSNTNWQGIITQIRIDPANKGISYTNSDTIGIDFISLVQLDWNFNNAGNTDDWTMTNIENCSVGAGIFYIDPGALDPNITSPIISKDAAEFDSIFVRMASNAPDRVGAIYFTTENFPSWNENKKVPFTVLNDGKYYKYAIHMNSNPNWWGIITGIRIDPANTGIAGTGSDTIGIDCITLY